jgi:glucose/arabinose dehydrogenase
VARAAVRRACFAATLIATLASCGGGSSSEGVPATSTCQGGDILVDTGGTNGFGRVFVTDAAIANFAPIDMAFVPGMNGAFIVASQAGFLHFFNGSCTPVNAVDVRSLLPVGSSSGEQGLLNIELHPGFAANHFLFAYHTSSANMVNSVSRMTVTFDGGGNLVVGDVVRIIDFRKADAATAGNHNGGGLVFAPDGSLLASVGDGGASAANAQDDGRLLGKVVRLAPSLVAGTGGYSVPAGNMFPAGNPRCTNSAQSATDCPEILAKGLRNPFRMSIDGNIVFVGDVGTGYEEINSFDYTRNTLNFGWPTHDGPAGSSALAGYRNPIVAYRRDVEAVAFRAEDPMATNSGAASVVVGDVYHGPNYAGLLSDALLFGDFFDGYNRCVGVAAGADGNGAITDSDGVPGAHLVHEDAISSYVRGPDGFVYMTALFGPPAIYRLVRP